MRAIENLDLFMEGFMMMQVRSRGLRAAVRDESLGWTCDGLFLGFIGKKKALTK